MLPLSLTWLRLVGSWTVRAGQVSASLVYLHLHEFLPAETASGLPWPLRKVLTRNCGQPAWDVLDRALDRLGGRFTTCAELLKES
jgi:hypothetical protein